MTRFFIKKAIRHPGALRRSLHIRKGQKIPIRRLRAAARRGGTMGRRARLALTLRRFH